MESENVGRVQLLLTSDEVKTVSQQLVRLFEDNEGVDPISLTGIDLIN